MKHLLVAFKSVISLAAFSATCAMAATFNLSPGGNLNLAIENASPGDTILLSPGTYTPQSTLYISGAAAQFFWLTKAVTVMGTGGAGATILNANPSGGGLFYGLWVRPINTLVGGTLTASIPSGAVLDGVTINSPLGGIVVSDPEGSTVGGIRNVQIRNTIINSDTSGSLNSVDGIVLQAVTDSVIDNVTVNKSASVGINIANSSRNIVMNSRVNDVRLTHAIVLIGGSNNQLLNNTVVKAARHAIAVKNSNYARVEGNTVSGYFDEGINFTDSSSFGSIVHNTTEADAYRFSPTIPANKSRKDGVGFWLNCGSNANYLAGNYTRGAPEVGVAVYASSNNYILGNVVTENLQGGILTRNLRDFCDPAIASASSVTDYNVLHRNSTTYQEQGGGILAKGSSTNNDIAFNYISSINPLGQKLVTAAGTGGFTLDNTASNKIYVNTVFDSIYAANASGTFPGTQFFRNRFVKTNELVITNTGTIKIDDEFAVGGNFWDAPGISGNPGPNITPYSKITVQDTNGVVVPSSGIVDRYPYALENFGRGYDATIKFPKAGAVIAAGRRARIEWHSDACTYVNVIYNAGGPTALIIASKVPNTGYYTWNVPTSLAPSSAYIAGVECLTSSGASTGVFKYSPPFTIANNTLTLLAPHGAHVADAGSTMRVAWRKTDSTANVNVFLSYSGGAETLMASTSVNPFVDIVLPNVTTDTARIRISNATGQDGTDGYFSIRRSGATGLVTSISANQNIQIGYVHNLTWASVSGATTVDLAFWDGAAYRNIIQNLADRGSYSWFVQEVGTNDSKVRVTFKGSTGAVLSTVESATMNIVYRTDTGVLQTRYRLFNLNTREHLYTSDLNEYTVLGGFADWKAEGPSMKTYSSLNTIGGVKLRPYYRLFNMTTRLHYWTIDRADYFNKRASPATWNQEGVDGYILPSQVSGTVPLYRIYFAPLDKFLWTVDANEYTFLTTSAGWTVAGVPGLPPGVEGYVYQ